MSSKAKKSTKPKDDKPSCIDAAAKVLAGKVRGLGIKEFNYFPGQSQHASAMAWNRGTSKTN